MRRQSVTARFPTMERLALIRLRERFPGMRQKGFSAAVLLSLPEIKSGRIDGANLRVVQPRRRRYRRIASGTRPACATPTYKCHTEMRMNPWWAPALQGIGAVTDEGALQCATIA